MSNDCTEIVFICKHLRIDGTSRLFVELVNNLPEKAVKASVVLLEKFDNSIHPELNCPIFFSAASLWDQDKVSKNARLVVFDSCVFYQLSSNSGDLTTNMALYLLSKNLLHMPMFRFIYKSKLSFQSTPEENATSNFGISTAAFQSQEAWRIKAEFGIPDNATVIGTLANLEPEKKTERILEVFSAVQTVFPDSICLIAGNGSERKPLEGIACDLGIQDNVIFSGARTDIADVISCMDLFVVTKPTTESCRQIMESNACNVPVYLCQDCMIDKLYVAKSCANEIIDLLGNIRKEYQTSQSCAESPNLCFDKTIDRLTTFLDKKHL